MSKLASFLVAEAAQFRAESVTNHPEMASEWREAVTRLIDEMEQWIRESDTNQILRLFRETFCKREVTIGYYEAPSLRVVVGTYDITIAPWARKVLKAVAIPGETPADVEGVVEMRSSYLSRFKLYRIRRNGEYQWLMQNEAKVDKRRPWDSYPFDREAFEIAMISLLS
jgi:hypothetical protein